MGQANNVLHNFSLLVMFANLIIFCSFPNAIDSLTIRLIRRDEIDLNLFPKNLSYTEKHQIYAELGHSRALRFNKQALKSVNSLDQSTGNPMNDTISPKITQFLDSMFVVPFNIGSGKGYNAHLLFDTGSSYTWVQCTGCNGCFKIRGGPFNPRLSKSFKRLNYNDSLCRQQLLIGENECGFRMDYGSAKNIMGVSALENARFPAKEGPHLITIQGVVIGCATTAPSTIFGSNDGPNNQIAGIFGAARGTTKDSFMVVTHKITKWKFSYCLPPWSTPRLKTNLSFGDDVQPLPRGAHQIPLATSLSHYYVTLDDISVAGKRLHLRPEWFQLRGSQGGFALDTGAAFTYLVRQAYDKVIEAYFHYLWKYMKPVTPVAPYDLCYSWPLPHIHNLPSMVYHFEKNANLVVDFWNVFLRIDASRRHELVCMAVLPAKNEWGVSILGAMNQANYRFVHNIGKRSISFHPEKCIEN